MPSKSLTPKEQLQKDQELITASGVKWPEGAKVTPMMRQWLSSKKQSPSSILLFRMGDFYELFGEDAERAAPILELTLTSRDKGKNNFPMAGFPHHAAPSYIAKLIGAGHKVALCDQLEDPALAKGIVKRDITRIVTPGLLLEDETLVAGNNNYLMALWGMDEQIGLAALDVSTGDFVCTVTRSTEQVLNEILRLSPAELVLIDDEWHHELFEDWKKRHPGMLQCRIEWRHHSPKDLEKIQALGLIDPVLETGTFLYGMKASALVLAYVMENQNGLPGHLAPPRPYAIDHHLIVDETTRFHLNLVGPTRHRRQKGTLLWALDKTQTAMGSRHLQQRLLAPSTNKKQIEVWHNEVESLMERPATLKGLGSSLRGVYDLERLTARVASKRASPRDIGQLRKSLNELPALIKVLKKAGTQVLSSKVKEIDALDDMRQKLNEALVEEPPLTQKEGGIFCQGYDSQLDEFVMLATDSRQMIIRIEERERKATGIPNLKVKHTRVFGYYIEVTRTHLSRVPEHYRRKQTIANGERYVTDELKVLEEKITSAEIKRLAKEALLFESLREFLADNAQRFLDTARKVAALDVIFAFATVSLERKYQRPQVNGAQERSLNIHQGRHPILELLGEELGEPFVPNDIQLDDQESQLLLITGPNMAGKSTVMRQVALIQILSQMGCFVPAQRATLSLCDRVFARVGAADDLARGRSTFMVEMAETSHILKNATPFSLVLLDEIGRGTSTYDGLAIAWAVTEYLHQQVGARTLFATHYHELTSLESKLPKLKNVHVAVFEKDKDITFLRLLKEGPATRSYGVHVGKLAGLPSEVIHRATSLLEKFEAGKTPLKAGNDATNQLVMFPLPSESVQVPPSALTWVEEELQRVEIDELTPLDALNMLSKLKNRVGQSEDLNIKKHLKVH